MCIAKASFSLNYVASKMSIKQMIIANSTQAWSLGVFQWRNVVFRMDHYLWWLELCVTNVTTMDGR